MGDGGESGVMHLRLFIVCVSVLFVMVPMATNTLRALLCKDECVLVLLLAVQMYVRGCDLVTGHSLCACLRVYKFLILRFSVVDDHHSVLSTGCLNIKSLVLIVLNIWQTSLFWQYATKSTFKKCIP